MPNALAEAKFSAISAIEALAATLADLRDSGQDSTRLREAGLSAISDTISHGIRPIIARISQMHTVTDSAADPYQRRQDWLRMRSFEALLHGSVQGALLGAANRLQSAALKPAETVAELMSNLALCLDHLKGAAVEPFNFELALVRHIELWKGVISIEVRISPAASDDLAANPTAAQCALEVIREGINNAVKHGKPRNMEVQVDAEMPGGLAVRVSNDGTRVANRRRPGFGSAILDQLSSEWEITAAADRVVLRALVSTRRAEQHRATDNA
jgi:hypothetical protein